MFRVSLRSPGLGRPAVERAPSGHRARPHWFYGVGRCVANTATHRTPTSYYAPSFRFPWRVASAPWQLMKCVRVASCALDQFGPRGGVVCSVLELPKILLKLNAVEACQTCADNPK
jgi:hypothetical protein